MAGKFGRYWPMTEGGPYDKGQHKIYKCVDCGAECEAGEDWSGEPNPHCCAKHCKSRDESWSPGNSSNKYRRNFDGIFPNSPGAGI